MDFYLLEWPDDLDIAAYAHATDGIEVGTTCELCGRNWFRPTKELDIELYGLNISDFVWTLGARLVVTDRLLKGLVKAQISGFSARPVSLSYISGRGERNLLEESWHIEPPLLHHLQILTNNSSPPHESASLSPCPICGQHDFVCWNPPNLLVDSTRWNGADVFTHRYVDVIITQRFLDVLKQKGGYNYKISRLQIC
jgi:hypothetical protein